MKPPQEGRNTGAPSLRGLQGRSATGLNGQAAKDEVSAVWRGLDAGKYFWRSGREKCFSLDIPFNRTSDVHIWNTVFLSNHDNPRVVSAFGDDSPAYRVASAKLLATMLLTLKGTPFIYQGDELGMTNYPFKNIAEFDDIEVKNGWKANVLTKVSAEDYIANLRKTSRDNSDRK